MISKKRRNFLFFEAAILTFLIYLSALILTGYLDEYRIDFLEQEQKKFNILEESSLAQNYFLEHFETEYSCQEFLSKIDEKNVELRKIGEDLGNFGSLFLDSNLENSEYYKRVYYLNQLDLYFQVLEYNENCLGSIIPVFYFFSESSSFDIQGAYLEQFALNHKNETLVFSFDIDFEDDFIIIELKEKLGVSNSPFIKVGNKTISNGWVSSLNEISVEYLRQRGEIK